MKPRGKTRVGLSVQGSWASARKFEPAAPRGTQAIDRVSWAIMRAKD